MNILSKLSNLFTRADILSPSTYSSFFSSFVPSLAGVTVTNKTAMQHTTVFACLIVLSEGVAGLPLHTYKRTNKGKEKARKHKLYSVLQLKPNDEMTSFTFIQALMLNLLTSGFQIP